MNLTADLGHASAGEALAFGETVAPRLAPDTASELSTDGVVVGARAHQVTDIDLIRPEQAKLVALACSRPPDGLERWTMELLAQ